MDNEILEQSLGCGELFHPSELVFGLCETCRNMESEMDWEDELSEDF